MLGNANDPSLLVADSWETPVALCTTTTLAPGTIAPVLSVTTPEMVEVTPPCPAAGAERTKNDSKRVKTATRGRATRVTLDQDGCVPVLATAKMGTNSR